jgi:copper oxidase (laccase) domain-containing protein
LKALEAQGAGKLLAAIGPHISLASFEVGQDVAQQLVDASPEEDIVDRSGPKPHVNLRKMVRAQLRGGGLRDSEIDDVPGCTVIERDRFFSYRRDGNPSGRMLSAIVGRGCD